MQAETQNKKKKIFFWSGVTLLGKAGNPKVKIEVRGLGYVFLAYIIVRYYHFVSVIC